MKSQNIRTDELFLYTELSLDMVVVLRKSSHSFLLLSHWQLFGLP